ncbi:MAG: tetratricopeptide repeat protein [Bacteroidales bacterium]
MDKKSVERNYQRIENCVHSKQLKDALDILKDLVISSRRGEFISQYELLDNTYENLLKYSVEGVKDPERENIYKNLLVSVLELADVALQSAYTNYSDQYIYRLKKKIDFESKYIKEEAISSIESLVFDEELSDVLQSSIDSTINEKEEYEKHQEILRNIFNLIWLTDKFKESDEKIIQLIFKGNHFSWYEQAITISAITLSAFRCFDEKKINLLIDFLSNENDQIRHRALVGLFIVLFMYDKRIELYPKIAERIHLLDVNDDLEKNIELVAIQFLKSKETEKISKKLQEEILPEMIKFQPKIRDKLDLDNILSDDFTEDKNPDWERVFEEDPDLLDKLQEISKLQIEGADVFMSTFSRLKNFNFFNDLVNWFRPFDKQNFELQEALKNEDETFNKELLLDGLSQSFFMCNSDKYSFCLNIPAMPQMQKSMMIEMFNAELESIKELQSEDEILNKSAHIKSIYSQYIHDLYRFYKLHPLRTEFFDIFNLKFDFYKCSFVNILIKDENIIRNFGEYLFEKEYYEQASEVYIKLNEKGDNSLEIFEKIGYCFQKLKQYEQALTYYKKAELYDSNRAWNLKKIALCYRYLKDFKESLKYYLEVEKLEPDNLYVQTFIGHSYLDLKEFEKALNYYYKVELLAEENKKVLRPIAWCSFATGKLDSAKKYLENLIKEDANKYDFMNLGHVEWCLGNKMAAIKNYKLSINRNDNNLKSFMVGFEEDKRYLINHGVDSEDIPLMLDFLKYNL